MAFFLHYFTLTCVVWMTINAVQMYKAFTQVSNYGICVHEIYTFLLNYTYQVEYLNLVFHTIFKKTIPKKIYVWNHSQVKTFILPL